MGKQVAAGLCGGVAQLGEHLPCKQGVKSSNLSISIVLTLHLRNLRFLRSRAGTLYIRNSITAHECEYSSQF